MNSVGAHRCFDEDGKKGKDGKKGENIVPLGADFVWRRPTGPLASLFDLLPYPDLSLPRYGGVDTSGFGNVSHLPMDGGLPGNRVITSYTQVPPDLANPYDRTRAAGVWIAPIDRVAIMYGSWSTAGARVWSGSIATNPDDPAYGELVGPVHDVGVGGPELRGFSGTTIGEGTGRQDALFVYCDPAGLGRITLVSVSGLDGRIAAPVTVARGTITGFIRATTPVVCGFPGRSDVALFTFVRADAFGERLEIGLLSRNADETWAYRQTASVAVNPANAAATSDYNVAAVPERRGWTLAWYAAPQHVMSLGVGLTGVPNGAPLTLALYDDGSVWHSGIALRRNPATGRYLVQTDHDLSIRDRIYPPMEGVGFRPGGQTGRYTASGTWATEIDMGAGMEFVQAGQVTGLSCSDSVECDPNATCQDGAGIPPPRTSHVGGCYFRLYDADIPALRARMPMWAGHEEEIELEQQRRIWVDPGNHASAEVHLLARVPAHRTVVAVFSLNVDGGRTMRYTFLPET